jgi:hypothetical protein
LNLNKKCTGIDKATADLFPDDFVESELGLIPKGWTTKQLKDIAVRHVEKIKIICESIFRFAHDIGFHIIIFIIDESQLFDK